MPTNSRQLLEAKWSKSAKREEAEAVLIINEEDDDDVPALPPGFRYRETGYE